MYIFGGTIGDCLRDTFGRFFIYFGDKMTDNKPTHEDELRACPFCGAEGNWLHGWDIGNLCATVQCSSSKCCLSRTDIINGNEWNTRASTPPAPQAEGEVGEALTALNKSLGLSQSKYNEFAAVLSREHWKTLIQAAQLRLSLAKAEDHGRWRPINEATTGSRMLVGCWSGNEWLQSFATIVSVPGIGAVPITHDPQGPDSEFVTHCREIPPAPQRKKKTPPQHIDTIGEG